MRTPMSRRLAVAATALALAAPLAVAAPAQAATVDPFGTVAAAAASGSSTSEGSSGSLNSPLGQGVLVVGAALLISGAMAVSVGIRGGAIPLPTIPGING